MKKILFIAVIIVISASCKKEMKVSKPVPVEFTISGVSMDGDTSKLAHEFLR